MKRFVIQLAGKRQSRTSFVILKLVLLAFILSACVPIQTSAESFVRAVGAGDDPAILILENTTVTFVPNGMALDATLYIGGNNLTVQDDRCQVQGNGVGCILGDVSEATSVSILTGEHLSANIAYYRGDDLKAFYVRGPQ